MPIKIKKLSLDIPMESPEEGYMFLGFNEDEKLVQKNHDGDISFVIPAIDTGSFTNLEVQYLTVGSRASGEYHGLYSISQGTENIASGRTSITRGIYSRSIAEMSYASGYNVSASGYLSYVWGKGKGTVDKLESGGVNSFVHQYSTVVEGGTLSDYSAILGGHDHSIGSSSDNAIIIGGYENTIEDTTIGSVIIGGYSNIIQTGAQNVIYLGRNNLNTTPYSNTTYVRMLSLDIDAPFPVSPTTDGLIWYDPSGIGDIKCRVGGATYSMKAPDATDFVTVSTTQTITGFKTIQNNLFIGEGYDTTPNLVYVDSYNGTSPFAQFSGTWASTGSWGIGHLSTSADSTVKIGGVSNATTGAWGGAANLLIEGNMAIGTSGTAPTRRLQIGTFTSTPTASPEVLSLGGTYSSTAGTNFKLRLYDNNTADVYGIGVSSGQMDIGVPASNTIAFYIGGVQKMYLGTSSLNIPSGTVYAGSLSATGTITAGSSINVGGTVNCSWVTVTNSALVTNFNSDYLDSQHGSYYTNAGNLTGTISDSVIPSNIVRNYYEMTGTYMRIINWNFSSGSYYFDANAYENIKVIGAFWCTTIGVNNNVFATITKPGVGGTVYQYYLDGGSGNRVQLVWDRIGSGHMYIMSPSTIASMSVIMFFTKA